MQITCPACSKKNEFSEGFDAADRLCVRCGCDLSMLESILHAARQHLSLAKLELEQGNWTGALALAERSWGLKQTPDSARVAFLAAAALAQKETLSKWRRSCHPPVGDDVRSL
jgi:hypothetical protein